MILFCKNYYQYVLFKSKINKTTKVFTIFILEVLFVQYKLLHYK